MKTWSPSTTLRSIAPGLLGVVRLNEEHRPEGVHEEEEGWVVEVQELEGFEGVAHEAEALVVAAAGRVTFGAAGRGSGRGGTATRGHGLGQSVDCAISELGDESRKESIGYDLTVRGRCRSPVSEVPFAKARFQIFFWQKPGFAKARFQLS